MPHIQYFDRTGRALSKREAFEADGKTMRDGVHCRVPVHLADHAPRFSDGRSFWDANRDSLLVVDARRIGGTEGNRPGYRVLDSDVGRAEREAAHREHEAYLNDAWRQPVGDAFGAYPYTAAAVGASCTIDGRPGRLVREGGALVCRPLGADAAKPPPDPEEDDDDDEEDEDDELEADPASDRRTVTVDAMAANHQRDMARLYDAHARELGEAWRKS